MPETSLSMYAWPGAGCTGALKRPRSTGRRRLLRLRRARRARATGGCGAMGPAKRRGPCRDASRRRRRPPRETPKDSAAAAESESVRAQSTGRARPSGAPLCLATEPFKQYRRSRGDRVASDAPSVVAPPRRLMARRTASRSRRGRVGADTGGASLRPTAETAGRTRRSTRPSAPHDPPDSVAASTTARARRTEGGSRGPFPVPGKELAECSVSSCGSVAPPASAALVPRTAPAAARARRGRPTALRLRTCPVGRPRTRPPRGG